MMKYMLFLIPFLFLLSACQHANETQEEIKTQNSQTGKTSEVDEIPQDESKTKEIIIQQYQEYSELLKNKEYEKSANFISEKLFEFTGKKLLDSGYENTENLSEKELGKKILLEQMISAMEGVNMREINIEDITFLSEIQKINNQYYTKLSTIAGISMKIPASSGLSTEETLNNIKKVPDTKIVNYNEKTKEYEIELETETYALSIDKIHWKFIRKGSSQLQQEMLKEILPEEILK